MRGARIFTKLAIAAAAVTAVALLGVRPVAGRQPLPHGPAPTDDRTIVHVLNRLGYGPRPGDVTRVRETGLETYIETQLFPDHIDDSGVVARLGRLRLDALEMTTADIIETYHLPAQQARRQRRREQAARGDQPPTPPPGGGANGNPGRATGRRDRPTDPLTQAIRRERVLVDQLVEQKLIRAIHSERQLQEVLVDFWFNHFNVFAGKGQLIRPYLIEYERDVIRPRVFGRFRDLLGAVAESPAMLIYLDNWLSSDPDARATTSARRDRDQMPPRRIGRRFGVFEPRATARRDPRPSVQPGRRAGLNENYARELMELHTLGVDGGYTQEDVVEVARAFTGWTLEPMQRGGGFRFEPRLHDDGPKVVLGQTLEGGGGKGDGDRVLDLLASHPSTARFISEKLARRFVADTPPATLVDRAAATFLATDGDLREVVRTIIGSEEFFAPAAYRAKVKTPLEYVASAARAVGANVRSGRALARALRELGMPPYACQPPTGYADEAAAWVNTGALLARMNLAVALVGGDLRGIRVNPHRRAGTVGLDDYVLDVVLQGDVSESTRDPLRRAATPEQRIALMLGAPEFQRR
ncbi:MAG: DUF1800 domain-containing protein [Acidobacteria bacterium]|nr:DUF1800 domain-containing protein [Acidobacteriota bacterium]